MYVSAVVYMLMKKSLNYSISNAEDDKLLPEERQKKNVLLVLRARNSQAIHYTSLWGGKKTSLLNCAPRYSPIS